MLIWNAPVASNKAPIVFPIIKPIVHAEERHILIISPSDIISTLVFIIFEYAWLPFRG